MDYLKAFDVEPDTRSEDDWTEEDDAEFADMVNELEAEENIEEGSGEENTEESENRDE
jgi:hypothetical protein